MTVSRVGSEVESSPLMPRLWPVRHLLQTQKWANASKELTAQVFAPNIWTPRPDATLARWRRSQTTSKLLSGRFPATRKHSARLCAAGSDASLRSPMGCSAAKKMRAMQRRRRFWRRFATCVAFAAMQKFRRGCIASR